MEWKRGSEGKFVCVYLCVCLSACLSICVRACVCILGLVPLCPCCVDTGSMNLCLFLSFFPLLQTHSSVSTAPIFTAPKNLSLHPPLPPVNVSMCWCLCVGHNQNQYYSIEKRGRREELVFSKLSSSACGFDVLPYYCQE